MQKLIDNLRQEKVSGLSELQRHFIDFSSFIRQNLETYKTDPIVRTLSQT